MSMVYGQATSCLVYLGEEDECSKLALEVVEGFNEDQEVRSYMNQHKFETVREAVIQRMKALPGKQKNAVSALLSRRYFTRLWVLQEMILAPVVVGMLGSIIFDFQHLFYLGHLIFIAKMDLSVLTLNSFALGGTRFAWLPPTLAGAQPRPYFAALNLGALRRARARIKRGHSISFHDVVAMTITCNTSDERDRIYGILAISDEFPNVTVDYHLPVYEVYTAATVSFGLRRDDLEFLCIVGEHKRMKIKSLPSWCPDYSMNYGSIRMLEDADDWNVGSFWKSSSDVKFENNRILIASGVRYDTLSGTAVTTSQTVGSSILVRCAQPSKLLKLALNLPGKHSESTRNE